MEEKEVASLICMDLNAKDEESISIEPITNGVQAVQYLNEQWVSPLIQITRSTPEMIHLAINQKDVIITNRNVFGDWKVEY